MNQSFSLEPIGYFQAEKLKKYELSRQPVAGGSTGFIELLPGHNFEQALEGLEGFERIWLLFAFHESSGWRPKVLATRALAKTGLFATRSPHRPNALGLSCVKLLHIKKRTLFIEGADLMDRTPIFDIKPYLPYCDSFPDVRSGWVEGIKEREHKLIWTDLAKAQREYLQDKESIVFSDAVLASLQFFTGPNHYNRIQHVKEDLYVMAYQTWRILFCHNPVEKTLLLLSIHSGYEAGQLQNMPDSPIKKMHKRYGELFTDSVFACEESADVLQSNQR